MKEYKRRYIYTEGHKYGEGYTHKEDIHMEGYTHRVTYIRRDIKLRKTYT